MKRLLTLAAFLILGVSAAILTGCGAHNGTVIYPNSMSATIGNVLAFTASGSNITATKVNGTLTMIATADSKAKLTITIPSYAGAPGTMAITDIGLPVGAMYDSLGNGTQLVASHGTLVLNKVAPYLEGTFSFVCSDSTAVTSGVFKIRAPR